MTITEPYTQSSFGQTTQISVTSDLTPPVWFHWYLDGVFQETTTVGEFTITLEPGAQARLEVIDTTDPDFDPRANPPAAYPATRSLWWIRSLAADLDRYRVEQQQDGGDWTPIATVLKKDNQWHYHFESGRLVDLATYAFRIVPIDEAGNDGTAQSLSSRQIVRTPDAIDFSLTFNEGPTTITFGAAAA